MDNKPSRSCDSFAEDNGNQELRRNIVNSSLRNSYEMLRSFSGNSDALEAVKLDPAVLEAQVTMQVKNNVKDNQLVLENKKDIKAEVSPSQSMKVYKDMISQNKQAVMSLTPQQLTMLLKFTDTLRRQREDAQKYLECVFCKNNGRSPYRYTAHILKDDTGRVTCPVLRRYRCPRCGATGDQAHTLKFCPHNSHIDTQST